MSWEAEAWARQQRTGDPVTKAVLVAIANWINARGDWCFLSIRRIADEVEVSERTVQRHIARLEGLMLLEKTDRHRDDGGQAANSFCFPSYKPVKVSHIDPPAKLSPPGDNSSGAGCHPRHPPVTLLSPLIKTDITPSSARALDAPKGADERVSSVGRAGKAARIADDWTPPTVDQLSPAAMALAKGWPSGAYQAEAEAFANYWAGEGGAKARKADWSKTWCNWVVTVSAKVLRAEKAGVKHGVAPDLDAAPCDLVKLGEGVEALAIRRAVQSSIGAASYRAWIDPLSFAVQAGVVTVRGATAFKTDQGRERFDHQVEGASRQVLGSAWTALRWAIGNINSGGDHHHG